MIATAPAPTARVHVERREPAPLRRHRLLVDVEIGLRAPVRRLPMRLLYHGAGAARFRATQRGLQQEDAPQGGDGVLLERHAEAIAALARPRHLVELGGGASAKLHPVARACAGSLATYAVLDVDETGAREALQRFGALDPDHPRLRLVAGDIERDCHPLPRGGHRTVALLGGTFGNFTSEHRRQLLDRLARDSEPGDALLLGLDVDTDAERQVARYSTPEVERFARGALENLDELVGTDLASRPSALRVAWNEDESRVEISLTPCSTWFVPSPTGRGDLLRVPAGDPVLVAISAKLGIARVDHELGNAGYSRTNWWLEPGARSALVLARRD